MMAIYRHLSLVKITTCVSFVMLISYGIYVFEMHVMYPKTWSRDKDLKSQGIPLDVQSSNSQGHDNLMKKYGNTFATLTTTRNTNYQTPGNDSHKLSFPIDSENPNVTLNSEALFTQLVIVTALTDGQVADGLQMIASVHKHMPDTRIVVYNIGIKTDNLQNIRRLCNVHVRHFSFETHTRHVRNLKLFAWRPIIIQESVNEFGVVFWADPNVRFSGSLRELFPHVHRHHGIMFHIHGFNVRAPSPIRHVYYETIPRMFSYFNVKRTEYYEANNSTPHLATGRMLLVNNSVIQEKLLQPLTRCALNDKCISPKGATKTSHKFDTSALAIIVYMNLLHEWTPENDTTMFFDEVVGVRYNKLVVKSETPNYCIDV